MGSLIVIAIVGYLIYKLVSFFVASNGEESQQRTSRRSRSSSGVTLSIQVSGMGEPIDPATNARAGDKLWVPAGKESKVAGHTIPGGMFYVGKELASVGRWRDLDPSLVNSAVKVARSNLDYDGGYMSYWPSYSEIHPESRGAYLEWLADGRSDPNAYIGYVFLFFYGLERRLLFDLVHLPGRRGEAPALIAEVERLLSVYNANGSFQGYGSRLLNAAQILWDKTPSIERGPTFSLNEISLNVQVGIAQMVNAGEPIPARWALAWVMGHPETRLRTPGQRCPDEFIQLFLARYSAKYGPGMTLKPNKRRLEITHRPASPSFGGEVEIPVGDLPNVCALSRPIRLLQEIAETAVSELEGYSRFIGRNPEQSDSLKALALLPPELVADRKTPESEQLQVWIDGVLDRNDEAVISCSDAMNHWPCSSEGRMSKGELGSFARMLEPRGFGLEPDPRFGGGAVSANQKLVIFRIGSNQPKAASAEYRAATLLLHLAAAVAAGDGEVGEVEERQLEEHLERSMNFSDAESRRLRAHLQWLLIEQPSLTGIKKRLEGVDVTRRRLLAGFAVTIAAADGVIDPGEVKTITKIYKLLGLDPDQAFGDIHSLQAGADWSPAKEPVTVRPAGKAETGYAIPGRPSPEHAAPAKGFQLDMDRVEKTLANTAAVSSVLAEIFAEEDSAPVTPQPPPASATGLDQQHGQLLDAIGKHSELSRAEFEALAENLGLLPDGAFETINEAAFEKLDEPLLEGEDPISVDLDVLGEMMQ